MTSSSLYDEILKCITQSADNGKYIALSEEVYEELNTDFPPEISEIIIEQEEPQQEVVPVRQHATPQRPAVPQQAPAPIIPVNIDLSAITAESLTQYCSEGTPLYKSTSFTLSGFGAVNSKLMFVGESRGRGDDSLDNETSTLLGNMIKAMKFDMNSVYIADTFYHPPLDGAPQGDEEVNMCASYLNHQIQIVKPQVIVFFGPIPLRMLMNRRGVSANRGQWLNYNNIPVMQTYHPAVILRNKDRKRDVWNDLQIVMKHFNLTP